MIVSFDPYINTGTNQDAVYVNFLRCVTAIATANAGTTSLTVNPYTTTSTVDGTKNCILSIIANTESGGWTTSANTHSIPTYPATFGAMSTRATYATMYKADFYNSSGKASMLYNKMTIHAIGHNTTGFDVNWNGQISSAPLSDWTNSGGQLQMTFGCSTTLEGDAGYTPSWSGTNPNQQQTSWTNNGYQTQSGTALTTSGAYSFPVQQEGSPNGATGFNLGSVSSVTYTMAVTKDYCIIWENVRTHNYASGYATGYTARYGSIKLYGSIMYGGFRNTAPWEDNLSNNPPWAAWMVHHREPTNSAVIPMPNLYAPQGGTVPTSPNNSPSANPTWTSARAYYNSNMRTYPQPPNCAATYMATVNDLGEISATATRYANYPIMSTHTNAHMQGTCSITGAAWGNATGVIDIPLYSSLYGQTTPELVSPLFHQRQRKGSNLGQPATGLFNPNLPTIDPDTGTFVPGAYPINFSRTRTGSWNNGGVVKGIYKSLTLPINVMKLYFSEGQTFTVNGEEYIYAVFNEDMYLIRKV